MKLLIFVGILQVQKFEFLKFRILEILNFHPCIPAEAVQDQIRGQLLATVPSSKRVFFLCLSMAKQ